MIILTVGLREYPEHVLQLRKSWFSMNEVIDYARVLFETIWHDKGQYDVQAQRSNYEHTESKIFMKILSLCVHRCTLLWQRDKPRSSFQFEV